MVYKDKNKIIAELRALGRDKFSLSELPAIFKRSRQVIYGLRRRINAPIGRRQKLNLETVIRMAESIRPSGRPAKNKRN